MSRWPRRGWMAIPGRPWTEPVVTTSSGFRRCRAMAIGTASRTAMTASTAIPPAVSLTGAPFRGFVAPPPCPRRWRHRQYSGTSPTLTESFIVQRDSSSPGPWQVLAGGDRTAGSVMSGEATTLGSRPSLRGTVLPSPGRSTGSAVTQVPRPLTTGVGARWAGRGGCAGVCGGWFPRPVGPRPEAVGPARAQRDITMNRRRAAGTRRRRRLPCRESGQYRSSRPGRPSPDAPSAPVSRGRGGVRCCAPPARR